MDIGKIAGGLAASLPSSPAQATTPQASFADVLKNMAGQAVDAQQQAHALSMAAAQGENVQLHEVIQAVSKAELTLQTLVTVRDRAVEAYQEIMRMPV